MFMFDQLHCEYRDPNRAVSKRGLGRADGLHLNNLGLQQIMEFFLSDLEIIHQVPTGTGPESKELPNDQLRK